MYAELTWLKDCGFNIWYDDGIEVGTEWSEDLANHIEGAKLFLFFVTPQSAESQNCRNEVNFALKKEIPILAVHLQQTDLPGGLSLNLPAQQAVLKHALADQEYRDKLQNRMAKLMEQISVPRPATPKHRGLWRGLIALAIFGTGFLLYSQFVPVGVKEEPASEVVVFDWAKAFSIVVLPFQPGFSDPEMEAISRGLSDEVVRQLTQKRACALEPICHALRVSKSDGYQNDAHDFHYVLRGNIQPGSKAIQIRAQLVRADNSSIWSKTYLRSLDNTDVFTLQSEVANSIAELSAIWLGFDLLKQYASIHPSLESAKPKAREDFLKAHEQARLANTGEGGSHRIQKNYLEKSIEVDPQFALPYLLLSKIYTYGLGGMSHNEATNAALTYIEKAIELNPKDPQNLLQAGRVHLLMTLDYRKANQLLQQGMKQHPEWGWFPAALSMIALREGRMHAA